MTEKHFCPDCGQELHTETYNWKHRPATHTHTCTTAGCTLKGTTLDTGEWQTVDLNVYRAMNAKAAQS